MINIIINFLYQFLVILVTFISRRVFIESLGVEYLGISGLFTNILGVLALVDLGIGGAMSFNMYKELVENNREKLRALNTYYKTLYNRIAFTVLIIGLSLLPFLKYLVNLEADIENLHLYYILNLLSTVFSYLFVYKITIVDADQKGYKLKIITCGCELAKLIIQIISLRVLHNYIIYLVIQVSFIILENVIKGIMAEKWYPFIKEKGTMKDEDKKEIWNNIKSMFFYKLGGVVHGNTANILISVFVNTAMVGYYSNYTMIFNKIHAFIGIFFNSILASIGNLNVTSSKEKKYEMFNVLTFVNSWLFIVACVGIYFVGEDVITALSGDSSFVLEKNILIVGLVHFFVRGMQHPVGAFRVTTGLFKMAKYAMLFCAIINIILCIVLGKYFGLFGVILATIISLLVTSTWYEPYTLYKKFFEKSPILYYKEQIFRALLVVLIVLILYPIISTININHLYLRIAVKFFVCCIIPNIILFFIYHKTKEFKFLLEKVKEIFKAVKRKRV